MMNESELRILLLMMDEAFDHKSWHGTNLYGSIRRLNIKEALWRPQPNRHNIWEIVLHVAYWKYALRRKLLNEPRGSFALKGSNWIKRTAEGADDNTKWHSDVAMLRSTHRSLRDAISHLTPKQLDSTLKWGKASAISLLTGLAAHDLYHAGQIQLLKRLYANRSDAAEPL